MGIEIARFYDIRIFAWCPKLSQNDLSMINTLEFGRGWTPDGLGLFLAHSLLIVRWAGERCYTSTPKLWSVIGNDERPGDGSGFSSGFCCNEKIMCQWRNILPNLGFLDHQSKRSRPLILSSRSGLGQKKSSAKPPCLMGRIMFCRSSHKISLREKNKTINRYHQHSQTARLSQSELDDSKQPPVARVAMWHGDRTASGACGARVGGVMRGLATTWPGFPCNATSRSTRNPCSS